MPRPVSWPNSFGGGHRFRGYMGQPGPALDLLAMPARVRVSLAQGYGVNVKPVVVPGQRVETGEIVGRDDEAVSSPVHSPAGGLVTGIEEVVCRGRKIPLVAVETRLGGGLSRLAPARSDWESLPPERIEDLLYLSGATGLAREGIPTRHRSAVIGPGAVRHVIVSQVGADAFSPRADVIVGADIDGFAAGIRILRRVMPAADFHIALGHGEHRLLDALAGLLHGEDKVSLHGLQPRYPQEFTEMLVIALLGEDFPFGFSAANVGVVVMDAQAVLACYAAVTEGRPVIDRVIALAGPAFARPGHLRVPVGTSVESVVAGRLKDPSELKPRFVLDSLLSGTGVDDLSIPVDRTLSQIIAVPDDDRRLPFAFARPGLHTDSFSRSFVPHWLPTGIAASTNRHGEERPCVQCGWCARVCPVRIIPHLIHRQARVAINELLVRYGVFNCIDCNLCSMVCPSKIELARQMLDIKEKLVATGCDNSSCVLPRFDLKGIEDYKGVKSVR
jgi:electron transport complex protein RnfC